MAPYSCAIFDMTAKMEVPTSGSLEVMVTAFNFLSTNYYRKSLMQHDQP
jgi:hypothetical protein